MKITKRQLLNIIKESIDGAGVRTGESFLDIVVNSLANGDPQTAANAVMDSYMIDDVWPEEEEALVDVLGSLPYGISSEEIENTADTWLDNYRTGKLRPTRI